jgi:translation initiation factor 1
MRPEPRKRIETTASSAPLAGLGHALAGVDATALPLGPKEPDIKEPIIPAWKPGRVVLRRERAQRGGKTVIVIDDFASHLPLAFIERVAAKVRAACGCGGTIKARRVEIQGDQAAKIRTVLEGEGFTVAGVN